MKHAVDVNIDGAFRAVDFDEEVMSKTRHNKVEAPTVDSLDELFDEVVEYDTPSKSTAARRFRDQRNFEAGRRSGGRGFWSDRDLAEMCGKK